MRGSAGFCIFERLVTGTQEEKPGNDVFRTQEPQSIVVDQAVIHLNAREGGDAAARVFDIHGRLVLREALVPASSSSSASLNLSKLPAGVYFIQVMADSQVTTHKIAKITR